MKAQTISIAQIVIPEFVERPFNKVADDRDRKSIEKNGVQQPVVLVADGDRLLLAKGLRRLRIARSLGIGKIPYIVAPVPKGVEPEAYVRELRLALDIHRQDLLPSQKCALVEELKARFKMQNAQIAIYLGIDRDSVTNWLAVRHYIPEVVAVLDADKMSMRAARVFDGMTHKGQHEIWKKNAEDLIKGEGTKDIHKALRQLYPPSDYPDFYRNPGVTETRLARKTGKRTSRQRLAITPAEKQRLLSSVEFKEIELRENTADDTRLRKEIEASITPIAAILRNPKLLALVSQEVRDELDRFREIYIL